VTAIAVAVVLGFAAGIVAGLFGVGGGILFVPTLAFVLGLTQLHAQAASLLAILPAVTAGAWRQHRAGNVRWSTALGVGIASIGAVEAGVNVALAVPEHALRRLFGALALVVGLQLAWRALRH
jgi:hypothetical protein